MARSHHRAGHQNGGYCKLPCLTLATTALVMVYISCGATLWHRIELKQQQEQDFTRQHDTPQLTMLALQNVSRESDFDRRKRREAVLAQRLGVQSAVFVVGLEESGHAGCSDALAKIARRVAPLAEEVYSKHSVFDLGKKAWLPERSPEVPVVVARINQVDLVPSSGLLSQALVYAASHIGRLPRILAVLRHPFPWAIRVAQLHASRKQKTHTNDTLFDAIDRWIRTTEVYLEVPELQLLHVEAFDILFAREFFPPKFVTSKVHVFLPTVAANVGLVRCWLKGTDFVQFARICERGEVVDLEDRLEYPTRVAARQLEFWHVKRRYECAMERLGYSMRGFENLIACGRSCAHAVREARQAPPYFEEFLPSRIAEMVIPTTRRNGTKFFSGNPNRKNGDVHYLSVSGCTLACCAHKFFNKELFTIETQVIVAFFKLYNNVRSSGAKGGMFARMAQVVHALDQAGFRVHFVCHCTMGPVREIDRSWAPKGTRFYEGDTDQQLDQLLPYSCGSHSSIRALFLFVTSLTVDMHFRAAVKRAKFWWKEPGLGTLHSEEIARRVSKHSPLVKRVVLTDDIHWIRAKQAFSDIREPLHIDFMLAWLKRREFAIYEAADNVLTVSPEDAEVVERELELIRPDIESRRFKRRPPAVIWAPFVKSTQNREVAVDNNASEPAKNWTLANRSGLVYIGMPHPVAIPSVKWLVRLLPRLRERLREMGKPPAFVARHGTLFLGGGGEMSKRWYHVIKGVPGSNETVRLIGQVSDSAFEMHLTRWRRVMTAPLFNNTGVATKIVTALSHGIPVVTTSGGCRGLGLPKRGHIVLRVADEAEDFVHEIANILTDDHLWRRMAESGKRHVEERLSMPALRKTVSDALDDGDDDYDAVAATMTPRFLPASSRLLEASEDALQLVETTAEAHGPPSLAQFRGGWYRAVRGDGFVVVDHLDSHSGRIIDRFNVSTVVGTKCRKERKRSSSSVLPLSVDEVKLFEWLSSLWVLFVAPPRCHLTCDLCALEVMHYLVQVNVAAKVQVLPVVVKAAPPGMTQRGFSPWVHDDELYLSMSIEPHVVLKCSIGESLVTATLAAVSTNEDLWNDLRALDGGCLTRPSVFATSPAILGSDGYIGVARTHIELGCLRFHEHVAYGFEPTFPFRLLRRSSLLPFDSRSFAAVTVDECRPAESFRVRSGKASAAGGIAIHNGKVRISYSSTRGPRVLSLAADQLFGNKSHERLIPIACPSPGNAKNQPAECQVLANYAQACREKRTPYRPHFGRLPSE